MAVQPLLCTELAPQAHSAVMSSAYGPAFQKLQDALVDNQCIILASDQQSGLISFRMQSESYLNSAKRRIDVLDGTILVRTIQPALTNIRLQLAFSWQESNDMAGTFRSGASKEADPAWYKMVFDMLGVSALPTKK
jgi:hypothetical protein